MAMEERELFSNLSVQLSNLRAGIERTQEFAKKFGTYLEPADRVQLAGNNSKLDEIYWKYFERFLQKIRGIRVDKKGIEKDG